SVEAAGNAGAAIGRAYAEAVNMRARPTAILARTMKGRGVAAVQDAEGAHGKPLPDAEEAIAELGGVRDIRVRVQPPAAAAGRQETPAERSLASLPRYELGAKVATRAAFGDALAAIGAAREDVVVLDGE